MSYSGSENTRGAWRNDGGVPPHAFDPYLQPELFRGVLTRRVFAFLIDLVVLSIPVILGYLFIAVFGSGSAGPCSGWPGRPRSSGRSSITAPRSAGRTRQRSACA